MKRLTLFFLTVLVALSALFWFHDSDTIVDRSPDGQAFLPALADRVNEAASLVVAKNNERIALERKGDDWVVASSAGYPAQFDAVRSLLIALARLEGAEPRTNRADRLGELLLDESGEQAGTRITVADAGGTPLADVWLGKSRWQPSQAVYMRRAGEDQAYLVAGNVRAALQSTAWLDTNLVRLPADKLGGVTIRGDLEARIARDETGALVLAEGLPSGRQLQSAPPFAALLGALAQLNFEAVQPIATLDDAGDPTRTLTFSTKDNGSVTLDLFEKPDGLWARLSAAASSAQGPPAEGADALAAVISTEQAANWNAAWQSWAFKLPAYRKSTLMAGWSDWLQPELAEPKADETAPEPAETDG